MRKLFGLILSLCLSLVISSACLSQEPGWDSFKQQEEYLNRLKKDNPKLYGFEKRLFDIQKEVQGIIENYQKGKITKEEAKEKLIPLLKEEIEIRNNPDYLVEQRLNMLLAR